MNTAKHTPTPWTLNAEREKIEDADGEFVTRLSLSRYHDDRTDPIAEANAAFIVRCVNAHDDLVRELREAREELGELVQCRHSSDLCNCNEHCRLRNIDAALAKAGA